jgi:hypothetical protein
MRGLVAVLLVAAAACGDNEIGLPDAAPYTTSTANHALGMSDVSILLPLPRALREPVLMTLAGTEDHPLVVVPMYDVLFAPQDIGPKNQAPFELADFQIVAVRIDVCDGTVVGDCPSTSDGRLRLVLQPMFVDGSTHAVSAQDLALHLFYPIPNAELPEVIATLRDLAARQDAPVDAPLGVSPAAQAHDRVYLAKLRELVLRYASPAMNVRMTVMGQEANSGAVAWAMRGLDHAVGAPEYGWTEMLIPQVNAKTQDVAAASGDTIYRCDPCADLPTGFGTAINGIEFDGAPHDLQMTALSALVEAQNPLMHDAVDAQCVSCHVTTYLTPVRAMELSTDPATLPTAFHSAHDTSVDSILTTSSRVIRAFGWIDAYPAISQRVANDTAHVLDEIETRYPAQE